MVSLKPLLDLDGVTFVAGRRFTLKGKKIEPGDVVSVETLKSVRSGESMVRSRYVIPVIDDVNDVPRQFQRTVKDKQLTYRKLNRTEPEGGEGGSELFDPSEHTIAQVQAHLEDATLDEVIAVAAAEAKGDKRVTLLTWLDDQYALLTKGVGEPITRAEFKQEDKDDTSTWTVPFDGTSLEVGKAYRLEVTGGTHEYTLAPVAGENYYVLPEGFIGLVMTDPETQLRSAVALGGAYLDGQTVVGSLPDRAEVRSQFDAAGAPYVDMELFEFGPHLIFRAPEGQTPDFESVTVVEVAQEN